MNKLLKPLFIAAFGALVSINVQASYGVLDEEATANENYNLGMKYLLGKDNYKKNYKLAFKWLHKAAEQDIAQAQTLVGEMYRKGIGVKKDMSKAEYYLNLACDNGEQKACGSLGR